MEGVECRSLLQGAANRCTEAGQGDLLDQPQPQLLHATSQQRRHRGKFLALPLLGAALFGTLLWHNGMHFGGLASRAPQGSTIQANMMTPVAAGAAPAATAPAQAGAADGVPVSPEMLKDIPPPPPKPAGAGQQPVPLPATPIQFDCAAGFAAWQAGWSDMKKTFCCQKEGKACEQAVSSQPYDCAAGFANWQAGWSAPKKTWCCDQQGKGCEASSPPVTPVDPTCAAKGKDCKKSKCCQEPGMQCYTKNKFWAQCEEKCFKGPNILDQESSDPWECEEIGSRAAGAPEAPKCSKDAADCTQTQCCEAPGAQCYVKNSFWAACKVDCSPGPDLTADDSSPWTCQKLGSRTPGAAPWVAEKCAKAGEDCSKKMCCAEGDHQCYKKDDFYGQCKTSCAPGFKAHAWGKPWSCEKVGMRTPAIAGAAGAPKGKVASWVAEKCSGDGQNCMDSQCCTAVGWQCYGKDVNWAACKPSCVAADPHDPNATWACNALGPRSWGLAVKGWPSLFCFSLYMPSGYEGQVMKTQLDMDAGIFACDGYDIFADVESTLGVSKSGKTVKTVVIPKITVGRSQDGTAGNAKLFMAVWDKIIAAQRFRNYDWTIKVDPDAVIIAWRMRDHMRQHTGKNVYVVNCNKVPGSPNFPMMFGAVEVFSSKAMDAYAAGSGKCGTQLPWGSWGEDYYMTHCLDFLGVGRVSDFGALGDNLCTGANCKDGSVAAFHPFKSTGAWQGCWNSAVPPPAPPPAAKPAPPAAA